MENKPQSERARELAGFVRGYVIANAPSFGDYAISRYKNSSWQCAYEHLADEIESLGEQESVFNEDGAGNLMAVDFNADLLKATALRLSELNGAE